MAGSRASLVREMHHRTSVRPMLSMRIRSRSLSLLVVDSIARGGDRPPREISITPSEGYQSPRP